MTSSGRAAARIMVRPERSLRAADFAELLGDAVSRIFRKIVATRPLCPSDVGRDETNFSHEEDRSGTGGSMTKSSRLLDDLGREKRF